MKKKFFVLKENKDYYRQIYIGNEMSTKRERGGERGKK